MRILNVPRSVVSSACDDDKIHNLKKISIFGRSFRLFQYWHFAEAMYGKFGYENNIHNNCRHPFTAIYTISKDRKDLFIKWELTIELRKQQ